MRALVSYTVRAYSIQKQGNHDTYGGIAVRFAIAGVNILLRARYRHNTRRYHRRWGRLPN